jgi:hypothetical protein
MRSIITYYGGKGYSWRRIVFAIGAARREL